MEKVDLKTIWYNAHENNKETIKESLETRMFIGRSHCRIISKIMNEIKLRMLIYLVTSLTVIGICIYAFVYLQLDISISGIFPFILGGLFSIFKFISELIRYLVLNSQNDSLSIKESTRFFRKKLNKIKNVDYYITFALCNGIAIIFTLGYFLNINKLKDFTQSTNLSVLFFVFVFLLIMVPLLFRKSFNNQYNRLSENLKDTLDYFEDKDL